MAEGIITEEGMLLRADGRQLGFAEYGDPRGLVAVSYTHLTLPTKIV